MPKSSQHFGFDLRSPGPRNRPPTSSRASARDRPYPASGRLSRFACSASRTISEGERRAALASPVSHFSSGSGSFTESVFMHRRYHTCHAVKTPWHHRPVTPPQRAAQSLTGRIDAEPSHHGDGRWVRAIHASGEYLRPMLLGGGRQVRADDLRVRQKEPIRGSPLPPPVGSPFVRSYSAVAWSRTLRSHDASPTSPAARTIRSLSIFRSPT